jgi:Na+/phosphate symporter
VNNKVIALLLAVVISSGLIYSHPAYAHNFGGDESASFLAKVTEIKTEMNLLSKHISDSDAIDYYSDALGEYWNANDTKEMGERNALLQKEIPDTIDATISNAKAGNQDAVNAGVSKLNGYLDEAIPVRINKDQLNNSTVQALAVTFVLKEALEKYGDATNGTVDLNDMSQMKNMGDNMSGMSSMSGSSNVVNQNAYENSIGLASGAQQMFNDLAAKNTAMSTSNDKISAAFTKLLQDLNNKADANAIMVDVHVNLHPNLISAYNIQAVPEFPMPALLVIISVIGVIVITRFRSIKLRQ